jgi:hypothetical protein
MYVAALAYPLTTEYVLLDTAQYLAAKDCPDGLFAFLESHPDLNGTALRTVTCTGASRSPALCVFASRARSRARLRGRHSLWRSV